MAEYVGDRLDRTFSFGTAITGVATRTIDVRGNSLEGASVHITGITSATFSIEVSADGTTFFDAIDRDGTAILDIATGNAAFDLRGSAFQIRLNVTVHVTGSVVAQLILGTKS